MGQSLPQTKDEKDPHIYSKIRLQQTLSSHKIGAAQ